MTVRIWTRAGVGAALLAGAIVSASGCIGTTGRLYVQIGPPTPIVETRVIVPGPGYVWIEGYHRWDGGRFFWVPGRWAMPPRPRGRWVTGHWQRDRHGWYFVEGHWR